RRAEWSTSAAPPESNGWRSGCGTTAPESPRKSTERSSTPSCRWTDGSTGRARVWAWGSRSVATWPGRWEERSWWRARSGRAAPSSSSSRGATPVEGFWAAGHGAAMTRERQGPTGADDDHTLPLGVPVPVPGAEARPRGGRARRLAKWAAILLGGYYLLCVLLVAAYRLVPP